MSLEPIFIVGRFRSGTSALWNIYDQTPGHCAFYEPCHDGLIAHIHATKPKPSHKHVKHYWSSYEPIMQAVEQLHLPAFGISRLLLEADETWPALRDYLQLLIDAALERNERPILQFNRMDFRLPWLQANFPTAKIVYISRNSREQWVSMVSHLPPIVQDHPLVLDAYELTEWSCALSRELPVLADPSIATSYERALLLWQLSQWMGERMADVCLSLESDLQPPHAIGLSRLADAGLFPVNEHDNATKLLIEIPLNKATKLHDDAWFTMTETKYSKTLSNLGLNTHFGRQPLDMIRAANRAAWETTDTAANIGRISLLQTLLSGYSFQRSEITRLLAEQSD